MKNTNKRTSVPSHRRVCSRHCYETGVNVAASQRDDRSENLCSARATHKMKL